MSHGFLANLAVNVMHRLGYAGLGLCMVLNAMGIPLSSEVLLPAAGVTARQGDLAIATVTFIAILAQLLGAVLSYWIGARGGEVVVKRYGRYVLLSEHDLEWAHRFFNRYGQWAAGIGYLLPFIRGYVGYAAGVGQMPVKRFIASAAAGISIWTIGLTLAGYRLAGSLDTIERVMKPFTYAIVALVLAAIIYLVWHRTRKQAV